MPTTAMNPNSVQNTPVRDRTQAYRWEQPSSMSQAASPNGRVAQSSSLSSAASSATSSAPITIQSLLQTYAASPDPRAAALDAAVSERNTLSAQNAQLWKLVEKQRTGYAQLLKELERVRGEREAYRSRLQATGENTEALLKAHKEKERREGKEGSLKSTASHSHLKNSESSSSNGHGGGAVDPRAHLVRTHSDDIPPLSQRQQSNNDPSWTLRLAARERQGSSGSANIAVSSSQLSSAYLMASPTSSSTQLGGTPPDSVDDVPSVPHFDRTNPSQPPRRPNPLSLNPTRSSSLPPAILSPVESRTSIGELASAAPSTTAQTPNTTLDSAWSNAHNPDHYSLQPSLPSAPILLTPATPAGAASLQEVVDFSATVTAPGEIPQPPVVILSASTSSFDADVSAKSISAPQSSDDLHAPRSRVTSRESRVSLPEEAKRYYATIGESPMPSPQASQGFPPPRSGSASPDKLSLIIRQGRSESPLRNVQTLSPNGYDLRTAPEQSTVDSRPAYGGDSSEFLDLDPDDTDSVIDSVDDRGSTVESLDPVDYTDSQDQGNIGPNFSRKDKKRAVVEDFPLPPATPPAHRSDDFAQAQMQSDIPAQYRSTVAQRSLMDASPASMSEQRDGHEDNSSYRENYDLSDPRGYASQSRSQSNLQNMPGPTGDALSAHPYTYRALPLLASDLPQTTIQVTQSSIRPNDRGKDVLSFIIHVNPGSGKESWTVEKLYSDVLTLDSRIRATVGKSLSKKLVSLPEGRLWRDHAPAKVDQRKAALELYLRSLLALPIKNKDEMVAFFTSGITSEAQKPVARIGYKEGYLTKRGKNFGGWKTRYFVLQGPTLEYYESRGGTHLGSIMITNAQIGRQQRSADKKDWDEVNEYRHAFLIIEAKKGPAGSNARHVLCAESDKERDSWVEILVRYVSGRYSEEDPTQGMLESRASTSSNATSDAQLPLIRRPRKEDIAKGSAVPISTLPQDSSNLKLFQSAPPVDDYKPPSPTYSVPPSYSELPTQVSTVDPPLSSSLPISSPLGAGDTDVFTSAGPRANSEMGHYPDLADQRAVPTKSKTNVASPDHRRKERRRSMNPLKPSSIPERAASPEKEFALSTPRVDANGKVKISGPISGLVLPDGHKFGGKEASTESTSASDRREKAKSRSFWGFGRQPQQHAEKADKPANIPVHVPRAVFGVPLQDSMDVAEFANLPAVVFRCIQYLEAKRADQEEGIYRLSGSSAVIKALKDRFNNEGDVDLLGSDECWDPHAIAGLLKSFLRELPVSILTRDLHLQFLSVIDFVDPQDRIKELTRLIAALPIANYSLLRALTAHLISVVQNHHVNKMNIRNVGIVFSPTLGIPAGVFSLMLGEFQQVFNTNGATEDEEAPGDDDTETVEFIRRNSKRYSDAAADELLGLSGRALTAPDEGHSDDGEDFSVHDESETEGADNTENESGADSSAAVGSALPQRPSHEANQYQSHSADENNDSLTRSRASNVAASRGLNIAVADRPSRRHSRMIGLPHSPRPLHGASPHSPHASQKTTPSPNLPPPSPHTPR